MFQMQGNQNATITFVAPHELSTIVNGVPQSQFHQVTNFIVSINWIWGELYSCLEAFFCSFTFHAYNSLQNVYQGTFKFSMSREGKFPCEDWIANTDPWIPNLLTWEDTGKSGLHGLKLKKTQLFGHFKNISRNVSSKILVTYNRHLHVAADRHQIGYLRCLSGFNCTKSATVGANRNRLLTVRVSAPLHS